MVSAKNQKANNNGLYEMVNVGENTGPASAVSLALNQSAPESQALTIGNGTYGIDDNGDLYVLDNYDSSRSQEHVKPLGASAEAILKAFGGDYSALNSEDRYYNERFQLLKQFYAPMKGNREIIELLLNENLSIGIATDPVTKAIAVDFRLRWANIEDFPYCLITHGENMHAAKPHPEYFKEILRKCGARAHEVVMIGDDLLQDISGAKRIGIKTILVKTGVKRSINVKPDFEVESIRDVPEILMQLKE